MVYSVDEGKAQLSELLDLVREGEEVVITQHGKAVAKLTAAHDKPSKWPFDSMKGEFKHREGWEAAMTDEEADAFLEGRG